MRSGIEVCRGREPAGRVAVNIVVFRRALSRLAVELSLMAYSVAFDFLCHRFPIRHFLSTHSRSDFGSISGSSRFGLDSVGAFRLRRFNFVIEIKKEAKRQAIRKWYGSIVITVRQRNISPNFHTSQFLIAFV